MLPKMGINNLLYHSELVMLSEIDPVPGNKKFERLIIKLLIPIAVKPTIIPRKKARIMINISSLILSFSNKCRSLRDGAV